MRPQLIALVLVSCCVAALAASEDHENSKLKAALLEAETKVIEAVKSHNRAVLEEMLHDQVLLVKASGRKTFSQELEMLGRAQITSYEISEAKAIAIDEGAAILTYKYSWVGSEDGQPGEKHVSYATSVWANRDGKWESIFYQETPIAE